MQRYQALLLLLLEGRRRGGRRRASLRRERRNGSRRRGRRRRRRGGTAPCLGGGRGAGGTCRMRAPWWWVGEESGGEATRTTTTMARGRKDPVASGPPGFLVPSGLWALTVHRLYILSGTITGVSTPQAASALEVHAAIISHPRPKETDNHSNQNLQN